MTATATPATQTSPDNDARVEVTLADRRHDLRLVRAARREGARQGAGRRRRPTSTSRPRRRRSPIDPADANARATCRAAVEKAGYGVGASFRLSQRRSRLPRPIPSGEVTLPIEGMTCASCVRRVEKALTKVAGVAGGQRQPGHREGARRLRPRRWSASSDLARGGREGRLRGRRMPTAAPDGER